MSATRPIAVNRSSRSTDAPAEDVSVFSLSATMCEYVQTPVAATVHGDVVGFGDGQHPLVIVLSGSPSPLVGPSCSPLPS